MSGEHGDGLARSLWNRKLFGPGGLRGASRPSSAPSTPRTGSIPARSSATPTPARTSASARTITRTSPTSTMLDFSGQGGFAGAVEMCSGVGACRKTDGGTMCPSYMVTRDEMHTTRGRANLLRLVMTGELPAGDDGLDNETLHEALDLCLQCKACKTECPSKVDMAKLKAEVLHQQYQDRPHPLGHLLLGHIFRLNPIASATAPLANCMLRNPAFKWLLEKVAGIDRRRTLPTFARDHFRRWFRRHRSRRRRAGSAGTVVLLDDCFTTYNEPEVGIAAVRVLEAAGYRVELAGLACCGRPAISKGLLPLARELARANVAEAAAVRPRGDADPRLRAELPGDARRRVSRLPPGAGRRTRLPGPRSMVDAFVADPARVPELAARCRGPAACCLHGHCQQKAVLGTAGTLAALRRVPGLEVKELDSGCCGMAGSFGYEHGHYEVSVAWPTAS